MLKIVPLGGLGEIGLNTMVLDAGEDMLLVDAGLMFPTHEQPGVDVVIPDFAYVRRRAHQLKGVLITHGHEDHVGALPYLLRDVQVPVYGSGFALALLRHRLDEMGISADLREVGARHSVRVGDRFTVEPIAVSHSVPDAFGFSVKAHGTHLIHTGDFKLDPDPIDGRPTDLQRLSELGDEGVDLLLSDSTNSLVEHETPSERVVERALSEVISRAKFRVIISLFSSHLLRTEHVLRTAAQHGRRVLLMGRSLLRNVELARGIGKLQIPDGMLVSLDEASGIPRDRLVVVSTGAQAEPRSGLMTMLQTENSPLPLQAGDTVVLSARAIPGNERAVSALINELLERGAEVVTGASNPHVHVSGHASPGQQREVLERVRPKAFVPIHGELRHLQAHLAHAKALAFSPQTVLARDGDVMSLTEEGVFIDGSTAAGRILRDRFGASELLPGAVKERQRLADSGVVAAVMVINAGNLQIVKGPLLSGKGLGSEENALLSTLTPHVKELFEELSPLLRADEPLVKEELTRAVRQAFKARSLKRPVVVPVIIKL